MSTASNHMKRSHRSQKGHFMAGTQRYKIRVVADQQKNTSLPALMRNLFTKRKSKADYEGI